MTDFDNLSAKADERTVLEVVESTIDFVLTPLATVLRDDFGVHMQGRPDIENMVLSALGIPVDMKMGHLRTLMALNNARIEWGGDG